MKPHVSRLPAALLAVLLGLSLVCVQAAPAGRPLFRRGSHRLVCPVHPGHPEP
ncbi:MAG: hypothetical protein ACLR1T_12040 [Evtepia gabavorous]